MYPLETLSGGDLDGEITCESIWDLLSAYADGEATPAEAALIEHHTSRCADCARDLRFMRETTVVLSSEPEVAPPPELRDAILAATIYRQTWQQRVVARMRSAFASPGAAGLGLAGAAVAAVLVMLIAPHAPLRPRAMAPPADRRAAAPSRTERRHMEAALVRPKPDHKPSAPGITFGPSSPRTMLASLPRTESPIVSRPPVVLAPAMESRPVRRGMRPIAIATPRRRAPELSASSTGASAMPPPVDPSLPATGATERTSIAASPPMPATGSEDKTQPVKTPPVEVHLQLTASNTVNASGYASLAGLRAKIHHDNLRAMSAISEIAPEEHRVVTVDLYKTHF